MTALKAQLEHRASPARCRERLACWLQSAADITLATARSSNTNSSGRPGLEGQRIWATSSRPAAQARAAFHNHDFTAPCRTTWRFASFDIVATENNTTVPISASPVDVDGHAALTPFTAYLDTRETYSLRQHGARHTHGICPRPTLPVPSYCQR